MDKKEIIERISYFRIKAKLSQKALSVASFVNCGYINRLETKKDFLPSVETLLDIIENLGVSVEEFFSEDLEGYKLDKEILDKIRCLPIEKREALLKFL